MRSPLPFLILLQCLDQDGHGAKAVGAINHNSLTVSSGLSASAMASKNGNLRGETASWQPRNERFSKCNVSMKRNEN